MFHNKPVPVRCIHTDTVSGINSYGQSKGLFQLNGCIWWVIFVFPLILIWFKPQAPNSMSLVMSWGWSIALIVCVSGNIHEALHTEASNQSLQLCLSLWSIDQAGMEEVHWYLLNIKATTFGLIKMTMAVMVQHEIGVWDSFSLSRFHLYVTVCSESQGGLLLMTEHK